MQHAVPWWLSAPCHHRYCHKALALLHSVIWIQSQHGNFLCISNQSWKWRPWNPETLRYIFFKAVFSKYSEPEISSSVVHQTFQCSSCQNSERFYRGVWFIHHSLPVLYNILFRETRKKMYFSWLLIVFSDLWTDKEKSKIPFVENLQLKYGKYMKQSSAQISVLEIYAN